VAGESRHLYAAVAAGSALGALARYLCSVAAVALLGPAFPWGTLTVNVLGSFLIGLYASLSEPDGRLLASPAQRQFVMAGFCGGFTTFSIFSLETLLLVDRQEFHLAAIYVTVSVALWLASVWIGYRIGSKMNRLKRS
jgi:CrcB protein